MHYPPVKIGNNRTVRAVSVVLLTSAMILTSLMTLAETGSRDSTRPDLGIAVFTSDNIRPSVGDQLNITIVVRNYSDYTVANKADLNLYEGMVSKVLVRSWKVDPLGPSDFATFIQPYDTTGHRGTQFFFVEITNIVPWEDNNTMGNNNGTLEVPVFESGAGFDRIIDGNTVANIEGLKQYSGFIALFDNAKVVMQQDSNKACDVKIVQDQDFEYGIAMSGSTDLNIIGCTITSNYRFYITVMDNARLTIDDTNILNGTVRSLNANVSSSISISSTIIKKGGVMIGTPYTEIKDSVIQGEFVFNGGAANITNTSFNITTGAQAYIANTNIQGKDISFFSRDKVQILAMNHAQVNFQVIWDSGKNKQQTVSFDAMDTAKIMIWREIAVHVADTTDMPIKGATVEVYSESSASPPAFATEISDENGNLTFVLPSDLIVAGPDGYSGNYEFVGKFTDDRSNSYDTAVTYRLAMHPFLTYNSSHEKLDVIFQPIPPKVCAGSYKPQGTLINGLTTSLTGCMEITTPVTFINSTLTVVQDKDFQSAIYIEGSGQLILQNTTITSEKRWNIYIIGPSAYLKSNPTMPAKSMIKANAVVGVDGNVDMSTVQINGNIRGKFKNFKVSTNSMIRGTWLSEASSMNVYQTDIISPDYEGTSIVTGGSLSIGGGLFYVNHFELSSQTLSAVTDADMWGNSLPVGDDPAYWQWYMPGSSLVLRSNGNCQVINSEIHYDIFEMHCKAFSAEKSKFNRDIIYGSEATSGSLKSVEAPAVRVTGDATVTAWFHIDIMVTNSLRGPMANIPITITRMGGSQTINPPPSGLMSGTDGKASADLVSERITTGNNHEYLGNYKVVVSACSAAAPYEFSVGGAKGDQSYDINFPDCIPAIEGLQFVGLELNRTAESYYVAPPSNDIMVSGKLVLTFEGGITTPLNAKATVEVTVPPTATTKGTNVITDTDATGSFEIPFKMLNMGLMPEEQYVIVNASYKDPSNLAVKYNLSQTLNITVRPFIPSKIIILPAKNLSITDKSMYNNGDTITVSGRALYDGVTPVQQGTSVSILIVSTTTSQIVTIGADGYFTAFLKIKEKPKKDAIYFVMASVTATHPYYTDKYVAPGVKQDPITIKGQKVNGGPPIFLIIIIIVVIVIVAAVAGIFLYLRMKTWGSMVECGECGAFIPENASKCPKCGTEFETEVVKCSECDAWIPALATECPKCGVEFKKAATAAVAGTQPGQAAPPQQPGAEQPAQPGGPVQKVPKK